MAQSPEYPDLKWMPPRSWTDADRQARIAWYAGAAANACEEPA